jgi:hypothetical protein
MKLDNCDMKLNTSGSRLGKHGTARKGKNVVRAAYRALRKRARRVGLVRALGDE